jgi:hypothetical protein
MSRLSEKLRYGSLGALLVLTLIAAAVPGGNEHDGVQPAPVPARTPDPAGEPKPIALDRMQRPRTPDPARDLFASASWYVAPPPAPPLPEVVPPPPPPPTAPPLAFSYMGRLLAEPTQRPVYFLVKDDTLYAVGEGELIDGTYRVEGIDSGRLALTYLPLNVRQFVPMGNGS